MSIHLGRNALVGYGWNIGTVQRNQPNVTRKVPGFRINTNVYPQGQTDVNFITDLFSAIAYAVWLTDQSYNRGHVAQRGIVKLNGFNPADIRPLRPQSDGRIFNFRGPRSSEYDLTVVLKNNPQGSGATILGPDGLYGNDADSVLAEVARTGKMFGKTIPQVAKPLFDRLERGVSSNAIEQAKADRAANPNQRSNTSSSGYDPSTLSGDAQLAMGFDVTKPLRSIGQSWGNFNPALATTLNVRIPNLNFANFLGGSKLGGGRSKPPPGVIFPPSGGGGGSKPPSDRKQTPAPRKDEGSGGSNVAGEKAKGKDKTEEDESNLGLILGISAGVLVIAGVAVVALKKKKKKAI